MPQDDATLDENNSQHPVSLRSPRLCGLFSEQSIENLANFRYWQICLNYRGCFWVDGERVFKDKGMSITPR